MHPMSTCELRNLHIFKNRCGFAGAIWGWQVSVYIASDNKKNLEIFVIISSWKVSYLVIFVTTPKAASHLVFGREVAMNLSLILAVFGKSFEIHICCLA